MSLVRCRAPAAEQTRFDVRQLERLLQQRIVEEINLSVLACSSCGRQAREVVIR